MEFPVTRMQVIANSQLFAKIEVKTSQKKFLSHTNLTTCEWQIGVNKAEKEATSTGNVLDKGTEIKKSLQRQLGSSTQECRYVKKISLQNSCI